VVDALPGDVLTIGAPAGEARLEGAVIGGGGVVPAGGEVAGTLYWSRASVVPPGTYVVSIRFDRRMLSLPLEGKPFPKLTRKAMEELRGERYRFRADHMILGGLFGPDAWEANVLVEDGVRVQLPADLAPGRYHVQAKMLRVANQPNHDMRDFFFDDDVYQGVHIGEITIEPWSER
jgi:hypothetical protein